MSEKECPNCYTSKICSLASTVKNQEESLGWGLPIPGTNETRPVKPESVRGFIARVEEQKKVCLKPEEVDIALTSLRQSAATMYNDQSFITPPSPPPTSK